MAIPTRVQIEVAKTNAAFYVDRYMAHYATCLTDARCSTCEAMLLDAVVAERHFKRLVVAAAREAA